MHGAVSRLTFRRHSPLYLAPVEQWRAARHAPLVRSAAGFLISIGSRPVCIVQWQPKPCLAVLREVAGGRGVAGSAGGGRWLLLSYHSTLCSESGET